MQHLNGHLFVSTDCETTGLVPGYNEIWQLSFIPLGPDLLPSPNHTPFDIYSEVEFPGRIDPKISITPIQNAMQFARPKSLVRELFNSWFEELGLGENKRLVLLGHNVKFEMCHYMHFFGWHSYSMYFDSRCRCTLETASAINDMCWWRGLKIPYMNMQLNGIARTLNIEYEESSLHDAVYDANLCAQTYKELLGYMP